MNIIETTFEKLPTKCLLIGFEGENLRATVRIDCASVFAEYPNATPALIVKPLFADAYPVVVDRNGTDVDWLITSEILSFSGDGEIQLVFYKDQVICKSAVSKIRVSRSLTVTGDMPDPVVQWIENANRKLAEVDAQIVELEGMVDTATDAATRAEQSASTASTAAEQAAGSAATASTKAAEAQASADTATAKAAEAALSATQAINSAVSAADSERGAIAKAAEAAQSAQTAAQKAEQITEAAQIATGKAEEASASATSAQASATDAASSATAAQASQTAAKASETAASTSATQAAQSVLDAGANAQTAMQKAAEASQSATNAAASATSAATSAETASTKAGEAAQSAQAVTETAEQLADSLEQIDQNTQDIAELDERKANIDGYYPDMTVGNAEQLNSSKYVENSEPYTLRTSGGTSDIGNREYLDAVVGGTLAWNQAVRDEASENSTDFADIVTVDDAVEDAAGVKVKIEPVQDLHGYDHPWPAGGGRNTAEISIEPFVSAGVTISASNNIALINGTKIGGAYKDIPFTLNAGTYYVKAFILGGTVSIEHPDIYIFDGTSNLTGSLYGNETSFTIESNAQLYVRLALWHDNAVYTNYKIGIVVSKTASISSFTPYSNICPITGWDGVKVVVSPTTDAADGQTYSITLPTEAGTVYGGELTVNADGSGSLVVDRASVDLGTLTWGLDGNNAHRFLAYNSVSAKPSGNYSVPVNSICNMYKTLSQNALFNSTVGFSIQSMNGKSIYVYDDKYTDSATFKTAMSGVLLVYELAEPITYTLTASEIRTLLGTNNVWSDAGQTALTYTGTNEHLTLESGKKYLTRISGTDSMLLGSGQEITAAKGTDNVFDLTQMFGTAVADYVYGQGAAFFRKWFPSTRYPYNAGELLSVEGLQSHDMVGFNQWDEEWELGTINSGSGEKAPNSTMIRTKNFIPVIPGAAYFQKSSANFGIARYDKDKNFISLTQGVANTLINIPATCSYIMFYVNPSYGTTYKNDICINLAHNGSRNGEYEPYEKHSYPLDSSVILRGIPKVGANGVYWDGDRYLPDGTVERRYGVIDLGTQVWGNNTFNGISYFVTNNIIPDLKKPVDSNDDNNFLCTKYPLVKTPGVSTAFADKTFFVFTSGYIYVRDSSFADLASFRAAMQGVMLVYELATPTTETAQPYHSTQWVNDWGTEEFVSTGIVPVGSETRYPANLRDKLQHLPDAASGNGSYLITQTDGQMVLTPFPAPPSTAGNYVLKATVTGGVATYTWEVAT